MFLAQNKQEHNWQPVQRVMFCLFYLCKKVEVSWFLMGDVKSEGIGRAYCEYGVRRGFRLLAVTVWRWSSTPSRCCEAWRGLSNCAWSGGSQNLLCCELSKCSSDSSPPLLGGIVCAQQCEMYLGLQHSMFRKGKLIHGLALSVVEWEPCVVLLWTSHSLWTEKIHKDMQRPHKNYDFLQVYRKDTKCDLCCFLEHIM